MQQLKKELALAELPAPVALTPEQMMSVAAGTAATLKTTLGSILGQIIVAGGIFGPLPTTQVPTSF